MATEGFDYLRHLVLERAGIVVDTTKSYLLEARIRPIARRLGYDSIERLLADVRSTGLEDLQREIVEAMATTETSFFRDASVYHALEHTVLPRLMDARQGERRLDICSAACSTGQEAYSLAMLIEDRFRGRLADWDIRIVAVDLGQRMIERARSGTYSVLEVNRGLSARRLTTHFQRAGLSWQVVPELRRSIEFRQLNLLQQPLPGPFDLVLMRNVMMYFADEGKSRALDMVQQQLRPDGEFVIGAAESLLSDHRFRRDATTAAANFYRARTAAAMPCPSALTSTKP